MKNFRVVLFDFDGLLFNSEPVWDRAYYKFLEEKNLKEELGNEGIGMGLREFIEVWKKHGLVGETGDLMEEFRQVFYDFFLKSEDMLMPGAREILERVKDLGKTVGLTTGGHNEEMARKILDSVGILKYFGLVVSSDDVDAGKPAPDIYLLALSKLDLKNGDALALEDSVNGVKAAVAAKVEVWGVNREKDAQENIKNAGAREVFSSLTDIKL